LDEDKFDLNSELELHMPGNLQQWQSAKPLHLPIPVLNGGDVSPLCHRSLPPCATKTITTAEIAAIEVPSCLCLNHH